MKRRRLLLGAGLAPWMGAAGGAQAAQTAPALPAVLTRPAAATPLATQLALLAATRAGSRLVVAGERGTVLFSDNAGQRWQQAQVPVQVSLTALAFHNAREGWAAGHFGALLRTVDSGQTWRLAMDGQRANQLLLDAASDDSQRQQAQARLKEGADKPFFDVALAGHRLFAVGAYGLALVSEDGQRFEALSPRLPNPRQLHLYSVQVAGPRVFIAGEQGLLLSGDSTVLAYGLRGTIWRSTDHGQTWAAVPNPVPVSLSAGTTLADGRLVLVAQNGDLLLSRDQGASFERRPATPRFPAAALAATGAGGLLLTGLRGLKRQAL